MLHEEIPEEITAGVYDAALRDTEGCLCEVRRTDNEMVFLARVQESDGKSVSLVPEGEEQIPPTIYNNEYKLVFYVSGKQALSWSGRICGSTPAFWKLDRLMPYHLREQRNHFRQPIFVEVDVLCINALYGSSLGRRESNTRPGRVLDISLGGLRMNSRETYQVGDHLLVSNLWLKSVRDRPFTFPVTVRWSEAVNAYEVRYGCSIERLSARDEDRLCNAIFTLQREDIAAHSAAAEKFRDREE